MCRRSRKRNWACRFIARAGTSPEITSRLSSALQNITSGDDFGKKVKEFLQIPRGGTPEEFTAFLKQDSDN